MLCGTLAPRICSHKAYPLKEIGDHLGHQSPETTRIYAKVDLAALRTVADFPLEGLL